MTNLIMSISKKNCNQFLSQSQKKFYNIRKRRFCMKKKHICFIKFKKSKTIAKKKRTNLISSKKLYNNNFIIKFYSFNIVFDTITFFFRKKNCYYKMSCIDMILIHNYTKISK